MNEYKIYINDILGSNNININTPIIILSNVPKKYLIPIDNSSPIYNIDIDSLQNDLDNRYQIIDRFVPIGQIYISDKNKKLFTILLANTQIIPLTQNFEEVDNNIWVGTLRRNNKINRSLGTIASYTKPMISIPVFPTSFLKKIDQDDLTQPEFNIYRDIYSDETYGRWIINTYKFNINYDTNKTHLKMIDSSGEISNMIIPLSNTDTKYNQKNQKIYFTAQGIIPESISIMPNDDDSMLIQNILPNVQNSNDIFSPKKSKLMKTDNNLILREKDEPWFTDSSIVGSVASNPHAHKITGYDQFDENNAPTQSDCISSTPVIGYSRFDIENKCRDTNIEKFDTNIDMDYINNSIMYVMCFLIILLLLYRFSSSNSIIVLR